MVGEGQEMTLHEAQWLGCGVHIVSCWWTLLSSPGNTGHFKNLQLLVGRWYIYACGVEMFLIYKSCLVMEMLSHRARWADAGIDMMMSLLCCYCLWLRLVIY